MAEQGRYALVFVMFSCKLRITWGQMFSSISCELSPESVHDNISDWCTATKDVYSEGDDYGYWQVLYPDLPTDSFDFHTEERWSSQNIRFQWVIRFTLAISIWFKHGALSDRTTEIIHFSCQFEILCDFHVGPNFLPILLSDALSRNIIISVHGAGYSWWLKMAWIDTK